MAKIRKIRWSKHSIPCQSERSCNLVNLYRSSSIAVQTSTVFDFFHGGSVHRRLLLVLHIGCCRYALPRTLMFVLNNRLYCMYSTCTWLYFDKGNIARRMETVCVTCECYTARALFVPGSLSDLKYILSCTQSLCIACYT